MFREPGTEPDVQAMGTRWPRILMYHGVCRVENDLNFTCTSPKRFEAHMRYLVRRGLRGVSVRELMRAHSQGHARGLVGLTFDDGYQNFLSNALPILEKYGFSATVFVLGGLLGKGNTWEHHHSPHPRLSLLDSAEVREVAKRGMEVGSHGMSHTKISDLDLGGLEREISDSREVLGEVLGTAVEGFCYPYGVMNSTALWVVEEAGYSYACAVESWEERSVFALPRIPVTERDNRARFAAKLAVYRRYSAAKRKIVLRLQTGPSRF